MPTEPETCPVCREQYSDCGPECDCLDADLVRCEAMLDKAWQDAFERWKGETPWV